MAERRRDGLGGSGLEIQHPLRADPFRDFAPFATTCLGPDTVLRLALPLPELQYQADNLTNGSLYEELHASASDLQHLLVQLQCEGPCPLKRLLTVWPAEQHDVLRLSLTWFAKLGFIDWSQPSVTR